MKVTTLIPTTLNDGTPVSESQLQGYVSLFAAVCGGVTTEGMVNGHWVNDAGILFHDVCIKLFVIVSDEQVEEVEALVRRIGKELLQEAMYFELDPSVQVKIIDTK